MASAHAQGFLHRDTHPHNILIRRDDEDDPQEALFADLQKARVGRTVSDADAAGNLAELAQWFRLRTTVTQRLRFMRSYLALRRGWDVKYAGSFEARPARQAFLRLIERAFERQRQRLRAKRDRRIFRDNRYFGRANLGRGWHGTFTLRFRGRDRRPFPSQPDRSVDEWFAWVRREFPHLECETRCQDAASRWNLALVRHRADMLKRRLSWTLGGCPNRQAFRDGHRQRNRDLPVASPVALFELRRFGLIVESVLLLEVGET